MAAPLTETAIAKRREMIAESAALDHVATTEAWFRQAAADWPVPGPTHRGPGAAPTVATARSRG